LSQRETLEIWREARERDQIRREIGGGMVKFRVHTIEEKRKLRNSRQKRKRKQRAAERKALERVKLQKTREGRLKEHAKLHETASIYCRKWKEKCAENQKLKELCHKSTHHPQVSNAFGLNVAAGGVLKGAPEKNQYFTLFTLPKFNIMLGEMKGGEEGWWRPSMCRALDFCEDFLVTIPTWRLTLFVTVPQPRDCHICFRASDRA